MIVIRLLVLAAVLFIVGALGLFAWTRNRKYLEYAKAAFYAVVLVIVLFLLLMLVERLILVV